MSEQPKRSANRPPTAVDAVGFTGNGNPIAQSTLDLARRPDGWTPADWSDRLLQLAERCETLNPERAAELRQAAALMSKSPEEHS